MLDDTKITDINNSRTTNYNGAFQSQSRSKCTKLFGLLHAGELICGYELRKHDLMKNVEITSHKAILSMAQMVQSALYNF